MLTISQVTWDELLDRFEDTRPGVERVAYLDGVLVTSKTGKTIGVVTTVTVPNAVLMPGYYRVEADAVAEAGAHLFKHSLRRLAQVHTHGNHNTAHSPTDDRMAYSQTPGAISIVLPHHARYRPEPSEGTVHVLRDGSWVTLSESEIANELRVVPAVLDFRRPRTEAASAAAPAPWWLPARWSALVTRRARRL